MRLSLPAVLGIAVSLGLGSPASPAAHDPPVPGSPQTVDLGSVDRRTTSNNRIALAVSNFGALGTDFDTISPSLGYPAGAGFEHLTYAGLWIGARALDGNGEFLGVTTGALDMAVGSPMPDASEFSPAGTAILERSSLFSSPYFDPHAVSEQDLVCSFDDLTPKHATWNNEVHRPLGVTVRQETYSWSLLTIQDELFVRYVIRNTGPPLQDVWVGMFSEFASGRAPYHSPWFNKKLIAYDPSLRLFREHYCNSQPVPAGCNFSYVPYWVGLELLGVRPGNVSNPTDKRISVAAWTYAPGDPVRDQDVERYAIMSVGTIPNLNMPDLLPGTGDPVELLAVGPFPFIASGDSVEVSFALVGGSDEADIQQHAQTAQSIYDTNYQFPTPTLLSLVSAHAEPGRVDLTWHTAAGPGFAGTVERRTGTSAWESLGEVVSDGTGMVRFQDPAVVAGTRYGYRVVERSGSGETALGEVWVDVPGAPGFSLLGVRPNPSPARDPVVVFSLERDGPVTLELLDVRGRRMLSRALGSPGVGQHSISLAQGARIPPGSYILRLTQGGRSKVTRAVFLE